MIKQNYKDECESLMKLFLVNKIVDQPSLYAIEKLIQCDAAVLGIN